MSIEDSERLTHSRGKMVVEAETVISRLVGVRSIQRSLTLKLNRVGDVSVVRLASASPHRLR